jgi:ornithine lipid ester-linked acyl 2-hydroxylase
MAAAEATTTEPGMATETVPGRRPGLSIAVAQRALRFTWLLTITVLLKLAELCVPRRFSQVETTPFIDPRQFEWHERLTSEWLTIQSELKAVLSADTIPNLQDVFWEQGLTDDDKWRSYIFYTYGQRFENQCRRCPETARLLQDIPGMKTALFSILAPGKMIPPHRGPYRGVMRYHLGLIVPREGRCAIRVGDETAVWEEGVGMMFDDCYEHEVWNDTKETRVVLFLDIVRPMKFPFNIVNSVIITIIKWSPTVKGIVKKQAAWDRAIEKRI